jgi:hypothetical protein
MPSARPACFLAIILAFLLLAAPGAWTSVFTGSALSAEARLVLGALFVAGWVCVLFQPERRMSWLVPGALGCLIAIKLLIATASVPYGFQGVYRSETADAPPVSFVTRYRADPFRIDPVLAFQGEHFGLEFLNNFQRYGVFAAPSRRDHYYPLFVTWTGYALINEPTRLEIGVATTGQVRVEVDGQLFADQGPRPGTDLTPTAVLQPGLHQFMVRYEKPANTHPQLWFGVFHPRGAILPIVPWPASPAAIQREPLLASLTTACVGIGLLVTLGGLLQAYAVHQRLRRTPALTLIRHAAVVALLSGITAQALVTAEPFIRKTVDLTTGNDWLAYEGNARDILHQGLLMTGGKPLSQGDPFYFYPFYPYALAAGHAVIGEDFGAVIIVNGFAIASLVPLCWLLAWRDARSAVGLTGLAALGAFIVAHLARYTESALSDSVFIAVAFAALLACRFALERWQPRWWIAAGILSAMAAATRPNFLTFVPMFAAAVALLYWGSTLWNRGARAGLFAAGFAIGVLPFTLRNFLVSGKMVMLVNSWVQIPYFLIPPGEVNPISSENTSTVGSAVAVAFDMFRNDPWGILWIECRKVLFTLGLTQPPMGITDVHRSHWDLFVLSLLFFAALVTRRLRGPLAFVLCVFALSHMAAMVLAAPWTYGYKTILPLHAAFLVGAAHLLARSPVAVRSGIQSTSVITDAPHSLRV